MRTITEKDLIKEGLMASPEFSESQLMEVLELQMELIKRVLLSGGKVTLTNIGTLRGTVVPPREIGSFGKVQKVEEKFKVRFRKSRNFEPVQEREKLRGTSEEKNENLVDAMEKVRDVKLNLNWKY